MIDRINFLSENILNSSTIVAKIRKKTSIMEICLAQQFCRN